MSQQTKRKSIAARVRAWREAKGLSLKALGKVAGVHPTTVMRVEKGQDPSAATLSAIARGLGLDDVDRLALFDLAGV